MSADMADCASLGACLQERRFEGVTFYFMCRECLEVLDRMTPEERLPAMRKIVVAIMK